MFLRPAFIFSAVIIFNILNGWALSQGLKNNNPVSVILAGLAVVGTFYFLHIYKRMREELETREREEV